MSRRGRAIAFAVVAAFCAVASASIASGYRDSLDDQLGELREVAVLTAPVPGGKALSGRVIRSSVELREVPVRFLPPDAIADPSQVQGRKPYAPIPEGSYLLASHLRSRGGASAGPEAPKLRADLNPVEIGVTGAGALAGAGPATRLRVDVVVAGEPVTGGRARVRVAASGVRLIALEPAAPEDSAVSGTDGWNATLALTRSQALELIEAENFAREIRLISTG